MKKVLIGILTFAVTIAFIILGVAMNMENSIMDTVSVIVKEQFTNGVADYLKDNTDLDIEKVKNVMTKVMEENDTIKNKVDSYFDRFMNIIVGKDTQEINLATELESIIDESEDTLKDYGVTISEEDKDKLISTVASDKVNKTLNDSILKIKDKMPSEAKTAVNAFNFMRSTSFIAMMIIIILVALILIAILKKSFYKWLGNFSTATIISGILIGIFLPVLMSAAVKTLGSSVSISTNAFSTYGYVLIGLGVGAIIINVIISKLKEKRKNAYTQF